MTAEDVVGVVTGIGLLTAALSLAWVSRPEHPTGLRQVTAAEHYLADRDLPREPELVVVTTRLQAATHRAGYRTMAVALAVLAVFVVLVPYLPGQQWPAPVGVPLLLTLAVALYVRLYDRALRRHEPRAGGPHVAHGARPRVTDYVTPLAVWWPAIAVAACGVAVGLYALDPPGGDAATPALLLLAWAAGTVAEAAIVALAFWLAARPQPAASADELALRNELTSDLLARLLFSPVLAYTLMPTSGASSALFIVIAVLLIAQLSSFRPSQQVRKRLFAARPRPPMPLAGS